MQVTRCLTDYIVSVPRRGKKGCNHVHIQLVGIVARFCFWEMAKQGSKSVNEYLHMAHSVLHSCIYLHCFH